MTNKEHKMTSIPFEKLNGIGNNFILIDNRKQQIKNLVKIANKICDIRFGVGADGLITLEHSKHQDFKMRIINADGSEPEMCGNGIRCLAKFISDNKISNQKELSIETLAGEIKTLIYKEEANPTKALVKVNMGKPIFNNADLVKSEKDHLHININGDNYSYVSMGNPHAVRFVDNYEFDYHRLGKDIENNLAIFPNKTNVEFIQILRPTEVNMRVWERGCGETFACGTGACASVVAGVLTDKLKRQKITVHLLGGDLTIEWLSNDEVMMTGDSRSVCKGVFFLE